MRPPAALGLRAQRGGAVVVAVALDAAGPRILLSAFLATAGEGDRLAREPYHLACEMERGPGGGASQAARQAVAEGRRRQDAMAAAGLERIVGDLGEAASETVVAALLVNRAGWMSDLLSYSLAFPDHPPVAEGLAVRDAFRFALGKSGIHTVETDEKGLPERACQLVGLDRAAIDAELKRLGTAAGRPWRKEQKLACLAAWTALAAARARNPSPISLG